MIPLKLTISGFLSYRTPVELDFTAFDLACIAGANGAGKSSLLDAITWALFGKARRLDDALINSNSDAAEVSLVFAYEGNVYRIQRTKVRDKTGLVEFQIFQPAAANLPQPPYDLSAGAWKTLTERGLRETDARIQGTLRLDYDTFVNASFFLQGKADQFTQQPPGERKRILGSILGLEIWETYRQAAADRRRLLEEEIAGIDGQLREINAELAEEEQRVSRLKQLEGDLKRLGAERASQEALLENLRKLAATLAEQGKWVASLQRFLETAARQLNELEGRLAERCAERDTFLGLQGRAAQIETAYSSWQVRRTELAELDRVAVSFREQEALRAAPRAEIQAAAARLEQEFQMLRTRQVELDRLEAEGRELALQLETARRAQVELGEKLAGRREMEFTLQSMREQWLELKTVNQGSEKGLEELSERRSQLSQVAGAACPLCGQPLTPEHRLELVVALEEQEEQTRALILTNQAALKDLAAQGDELKRQVGDLGWLEADLERRSQEAARLESRLEALQASLVEWQKNGALRLGELERSLAVQDFAPEARRQLEQIDAGLRQIGYDPALHESARQAEAGERAADDELRALEKARAALAPLEREIGELQAQTVAQSAEVARQREEFDQAQAALAAAQAQTPDLPAAEAALLVLQEQENRLRREAGAAQQLVAVLKELKNRRQACEAQRAELALQVSHHKQLERAFGKDGVPALLIEQALPQIEAKANEILDRLTNGSMSVRFITQAAYKEKGRQDLRETLEIQISDSAGRRDYGLFSGGEAFRVNFAVRLALSEVLSQRAGARLQTLVIDEGFGSQDTLGRQRLVEAINLVRADFAKILVITHIDELKDSFPTRIEVEKTDGSSTIRIIQ